MVIVVALLALFAQQRISAQLLPEQWAKQDLDRYLSLENEFGSSNPGAVSSKGMIAATTNPFAIHAGLEVLKHGGNAADAALTTSLAQIALTAGGAISYAGIMTAVYYDAASGKVYTLNAAYNTVQNEKDPLSIPEWGQHSGRSALVPGFMAGVQALHDRFGKLPFAALFGPAIWIADHGVALNPPVGSWLVSARNFITRLPETKRIFTKEDGELYQAGDMFRQPELAATLKKIASQGSAYMYKGEWAHHFVDAVQREGGKMTLEDLAGYRAMWTEPLAMPYRGYQVVSLGAPSKGGLMTLGSLKVAEVADLRKYGHYESSAEALYYLIQITREEYNLVHMSAAEFKNYLPGVAFSPESLLSADTAQRLWARIQRNITAKPPAVRPGSNHSAGVLAVDEQGNVASILHSLNGVLWGSTGIFVDGISIPDSACFQQQPIASAGPGVRLPEISNPLMVLKGGKPVLASTTIGSALHQAALQNLINVLDFGMDPKTSAYQPNTQGPFYGVSLTGPGKPEYEKEAVGERDFSQAVLDGVRARGRAIKIVYENDQRGFWVGIQIDPRVHKLFGGVTKGLNAMVEGY
jgi:gamma-glutamyltranspeptidase/glutathione hydrolase